MISTGSANLNNNWRSCAMNESQQIERDKKCKEFMDVITDWIYSDKPLNDEFRELVRKYKKEIEELEDK